MRSAITASSSDSLEKNIDDAKDVMAKLAASRHLDRRGDAKAGGGGRPAFCRCVRQAARRRGRTSARLFWATSSTRRPASCRTSSTRPSRQRWRTGAAPERSASFGPATPALWTNTDEAKWVGWLDIVDEQSKRLGELKALTQDVRKQGFTHAVLLGMGGSSLGSGGSGRDLWRPGWRRAALRARFHRPGAGPHRRKQMRSGPDSVHRVE